MKKTKTVAVAATITVAATIAQARDNYKFILHNRYASDANDLLTAGLGAKGLADPEKEAELKAVPNPTDEDMRRYTIYNNYRGLVDTTEEGGYGVLYGPGLTPGGKQSANDGRIFGDEYITFEKEDDGENPKRVTMIVQIPDGYDPDNGCIVAAPSPGSRGVYGAIAVGEWALKHNCAVVYTDKGTGVGVDDLHNGTANLIRGRRGSAFDEGANFTAPLSPAERAEFDARTPNRFAFKHAHSQQNPEKDWGQNVLRAIEFAFYVLNQKFSQDPNASTITKDNTIVIAASISNGAGAVLRAVEQDDKGLIDAAVAAEPNVTPRVEQPFSIAQAERKRVDIAQSRPLIDYTTLINVFQGCANLALDNRGSPFSQSDPAASERRCASLHSRGLLTKTALQDQADEALKIINDYGILPESNLVRPGHWNLSVPQAIAVTHVNALGRFSVADNLCNFSCGAVTGAGTPAPLDPAVEALTFVTNAGLPPTAITPPGIFLINNMAPGGGKEERKSTPDQNLDGALCLRMLATGRDPAGGSRPLDPEQATASSRIRDGVREILASGDLHGVPAIIVTGRNDGVIAPNFASRAYFSVNRISEKMESKLEYYEVTNAHHFDAFNGLVPGYDELFVPLYRYFTQSLDLMLDHLRRNRPLPPSQVVHTTPRGVGAPPITVGNVPPIKDEPGPDERITFVHNPYTDKDEMHIPD